MLASDTQAIADYLKQALEQRDGGSADRFANTRDTLCYATLDNQTATTGAIEAAGRFRRGGRRLQFQQYEPPRRIVRGGDAHLVCARGRRICRRRIAGSFRPARRHPKGNRVVVAEQTKAEGVTTVLTSGVSCPDSAVDRVLQKILERAGGGRAVDDVLNQLSRSKEIGGLAKPPPSAQSFPQRPIDTAELHLPLVPCGCAGHAVEGAERGHPRPRSMGRRPELRRNCAFARRGLLGGEREGRLASLRPPPAGMLRSVAILCFIVRRLAGPAVGRDHRFRP